MANFQAGNASEQAHQNASALQSVGRTGDEQSSSPQNKLKDIIHTLFKKNDQVAGDLLTGQARPANVPAKSATQDALTTVERAAGTNAAGASGQCTVLGQAAEQQQHVQAQQGSWQRDSASTLDADGAAPPTTTTAEDQTASIQQEAGTTQASAGGSSSFQEQQVDLTMTSTTAQVGFVPPAQSSLDCAGMQEDVGQRNSSAAPQEPLPASGTAAEDITCAVQDKSCSPTQQQVLSQLEQPGPQQQVQQQQAPSAILRPGRLSAAMHSEPCPNGSAGGARVSTSQQRKMLCASVDDLYQELFGDVPLPSTCSSAAQSPYGGHLASIRGVSSMSPMTTSSAFCHQHAAAAAIAGSGGMPGMGAFGLPAASPMPVRRDSNSMCSSYEGNSESAYGGCADASTYGDCAGNGMGQGLPAAIMDDMLPPGAYPPRVRILPNNQTPNPSRFSGSDGCSSSLFPDESPSCCSSSAGGNAWPLLSMEDGPSVAVSSRGSGQGWGSRGSLRYGSPAVAAAQQGSGQQSPRISREGVSPLSGSDQQHIGSASGKNPPGRQAGGTASAPGSADGGKPVPKSSLRTRWSNWISGSAPKGRPASSQNLQLQVQQQPSVLQQQEEGANESSQPWLAHSRQASPKRSALAAQSAPGNAAAQALYNSTGGRAAMGSSSVPTGMPLHQLVHCHSNPELVQAAVFGSVGHGRGQFQRSSALGGPVPPCARSLFGSVPQMERPLVTAGSVGNSSSNNSSGWLSGPGGVTFGAPARNESFGLLATLGGGDDAISIASADEESIRQVNADNVLSSTWGPGSQSASGGGPSGIPLSASHPKLRAFKYCCATSPLNHPGRSSPFNSARNSPFNSPRGTKDMLDLLPLRNAAASVNKAAASCPGSPLGMRHNNIFSSSVNSTPAVSSTLAAAAAAAADGQGPTPAAPVAYKSTDSPAPQQGPHVLRKQKSSSSSNQLVFESAASAGSASSEQQQELEHAASIGDAGASCSSSGGSNSSSKPPLQGRPVRGLLRTPPPPLPLPLQGSALPPSVATAAAGATAGQAAAVPCNSQQRCGTAAPGPSYGSSMVSSRGLNKCSTGPTAHKAAMVAPAAPGFSNSRRVSAPAGLSAFMMRFSSNSGATSQGSGSPSTTVNTVTRGCHQGSPSAQVMAGAAGFAMVEAEIASTTAPIGASSGNAQPQVGVFSRSSAHSLPLPLPSCSIDVGSPKQQLPIAIAADSRCSPRRQSSSRLGASGGFTTPSRLSHNSTMAEALVTGSGGGGLGGFALQRTSSCCSSSSGWPGAGGAKYSGGRSSNGFGVGALPGHDGGLLSTTSVPLPNMYDRGTRGVDCSDSSEGSWIGRPSASSTVIEALQEQGNEQEQEALEQQADEAQQQQANTKQAASTLTTAVVGSGRYGSCNGASDASVADCQDCAYPSWDSSSWSPLPPAQQQPQQQQQQRPDTKAQSLKQAAEQQQQQQLDCGQRRQPGQAQGVSGDACAAVGSCTARSSGDAAGVVGSDDADADAAAVVPPSLPEVDFLEKIGRGSFGDVFKGVWCGSVVAVKVIQVKQPSALTFPTRASTQSQQQQQQQQRISADEQPQLLGDSAAAAPDVVDSQAAQVALELAQHEYESWLNANLRHPNIVQLFTSFTIGLEERSPSMPAALLLSSTGGDPDGAMAGPLLSETGGSGALSWKTHLVMEYCELGTMQDLLQRGVFSQGTLPGASHLCWVLATAKEFCTAVSYLHSMDVVHGDLKSSNVLLKAAAITGWDTRGFVAKVSDFGLSRVMDAISAANGDGHLTPSAAAAAECASATPAASTAGAQAAASAGGECAGGTAVGAGGSLGWQPCQPRFGALSHAAPELIQGQELSKASDVYSIGVLLWELLTGQAPFYGMHPGQLLSLKLSQHTSQLLPFPPSTPPGLQQLCLDCWSDSPSARPSMAAVVQRINDLAVGLLGQEQAVSLFPDVAASLAAQRRQAVLLAAQAAKPVRC